MALSILLGEDDLRSMPSDLRDRLLGWYFNGRTPAAVLSPPGPGPVLVTDDTKRVSFPKFLKAGLISPGDLIYCRALKRQQRAGAGKFITGAAVAADGSVEYKAQKFTVPSNLAMQMVNDSGGHAEALNGYDYLFVNTRTGLVALSELRDQLLGIKS